MGIISKIWIYKKFFSLLVLCSFIIGLKSVTAQNAGSLFMMHDNFYAQMLNPAFMRNDDALMIAVPGLAGLSLRNNSSFKVTDFVYSEPGNNPKYSLSRFSEKADKINYGSVGLTVPLVYVGIPREDGMFSFYIKEKVQSYGRFPASSITWFNYGNLLDEYHDFQSGELNLKFLGLHELAVGYAKKVNESINFGLRGKLLIGEILLDVNHWNFGIETSESGDQVLMTSRGKGQFSVPATVERIAIGKISNVNVDEIFRNYFSLRNPGIALDAGITIKLEEGKQVAISLNDLGFIYFGRNVWDLSDNDSYLFRGLDISSSVNSNQGSDYVRPLDIMLSTKDSLRNVFDPIANDITLLYPIYPRLNIHFQNQYTERITLGITNQTILYDKYLLNSLSASALLNAGNFSFNGDLSLHGLKSLTFGGGFQWEVRVIQVFAFTDNLLAIYHPANQRAYSVTVGMNFLIRPNDKTIKSKKGRFNRNGKTSKYFPFYRKYR